MTQLITPLYGAYDVIVSRPAIHRRLTKGNLVRRRPWKCQPINRGNRDNRTWEQWQNVLITGVSRFGLYPDTRRVRVWRAPGTRNTTQFEGL